MGDEQGTWRVRGADSVFDTLDAALQRARARAEKVRTQLVACADLTAEAVGDDIVVVADGVRYRPTCWAFEQLCSLVGAPGSFLRGLNGALAASNLQAALQASAATALLYGETAASDSRTLLAVTGPDYGRICDFQVLEAVQRIVSDEPWSTAAQHVAFSDRDMVLCAHTASAVVTVDGIALHRGFCVQNSEFGARLFSVIPVCVDAQGTGVRIPIGTAVSFRHTRNVFSRFAETIAPTLRAMPTADTSDVTAVYKRASTTLFTAIDPLIADAPALRALGLSKPARTRVAAFVRGKATVWRVALGLCASAIDEPCDMRIKLERLAGSLLS